MLRASRGFAGEAGVTVRALRGDTAVGWPGMLMPWLDPPAKMLAQGDFEGVVGRPRGGPIDTRNDLHRSAIEVF